MKDILGLIFGILAGLVLGTMLIVWTILAWLWYWELNPIVWCNYPHGRRDIRIGDYWNGDYYKKNY